MGIEAAEWIVGAAGLYLAAGVVFALLFLVLGVARVDPGAKGMPWAARLLVFPGVVALWPLMLAKWLAHRSQPAR